MIIIGVIGTTTSTLLAIAEYLFEPRLDLVAHALAQSMQKFVYRTILIRNLPLRRFCLGTIHLFSSSEKINQKVT